VKHCLPPNNGKITGPIQDYWPHYWLHSKVFRASLKMIEYWGQILRPLAMKFDGFGAAVYDNGMNIGVDAPRR
jgi:hypothetical protein